ncbi:hypothetical protein SARC_03284 [Sphaeroforma arctica JP610]|uniref:Decapping nuclease n=1 Tax=Sphaeroforma arctica JP610 TaxID=667725 RepID=A0A0L0G653_9EUKA|nr:hypothetical protein SARC_03284 [Sphaeroforma arctica JP610]KNC84510.1 hypothetical protein SARC_03284 [Sphaeroforma arctica JP610]|eukprot:XP_014158412.1 hypothetical protein SARC_03284 [Sphaeroforma arctica JP610]
MNNDSTSKKTWTSSSINKTVERCEITGLQTVASYNWLKDSTLVVPGAPGVVSKDLQSNLQLTREQGTNVIDENHLRHPSAPLEPLFRSVMLCSPDFDFSDVDIVSDRNNIRKLHSFLEGTRTKDFRIDVCRVGDLVLLQRVEPKDVDYPEHAGFGFDFERVYAERDRPHSAGTHRRVVYYDLAGMGMLIGSETDAVLDRNTDDIEYDLSTALAVVSINNETTQKDFKDSDLKIRRGGAPLTTVKYDAAELCTKAIKFAHEFDYADKWLQMYLAGAKYLLLGFHLRGYITSPELIDIDMCKERVEGDPSRNMGRLAALLDEIVDVAQSYPEDVIWTLHFTASTQKLVKKRLNRYR